MSVQKRLLSAALLLGKLLATGGDDSPAISWSVSPANMARHGYKTGLEGHVFYASDRGRSLADLGQWAEAFGAEITLGPAYQQKPDSELFEVVTEIDGVPVYIWTRVPREVAS
jgi:hypothetical protein